VYNTPNILGLAFGLSVSLLIMFWLWDEMSFDKFHDNGSRIYRIINGTPGDEDGWVGTAAQLAPELTEMYPEIERFVRIDQKEYVVQYHDKIQNETRIILADSNFFELFTYELVKGSVDNVLDDLNAIVISEKSAEKYFGEEDPINQILLLNDVAYNVTGVIRDLPPNTYHQFDFVIRFEKIDEGVFGSNYMECWGCQNFESYILITENAEPDYLQSKVREFFVDDGDYKREFNNLTLQPIENIHFEYIRGNVQPEFPRKYIFLYASLAMIVLVLAIINNINLTVAIAPIRSKEVGLKKIMGAGRNGLIFHFIFEAFFFTLISFLVALALTRLALPLLNNLTGRTIIIHHQDMRFLLFLAALIIFISLASGIYPAIMLSKFSPIDVLKGVFSGRKKAAFRNLLVTIQFVISISFIIGTFIFIKQINFIRNKNLGYNKEQVLNIRLFTNEIKSREEINAFFSKIDALKNELGKLSDVLYTSNNSFNPSNMNRNHGITWEGQKEDDHLSMFIISGDKNMIPMLEFEMLEGDDQVKNFERRGKDAYIINKSAMKALEWEEYDGKFFSIFGENRPGEIIGVCDNFHYRSLHHEIGPCVIILSEYGNQISLKVRGGNLSETISEVKGVYESIFSKSPFEFYFLDQEFDKLYKTDIRMSRAVSYLTIISIIIACMGIFGLSSYLAIQRTKEIGIRKVMGSSVSQIIYILTFDVVRWVLVSFIIAAPLTYYFLIQWLDNFAYKTSLSWWIFALGVITVMFIALLTVIFQSVKAALKNPTEALRYE
jgi:putative ABC transport system permease protein